MADGGLSSDASGPPPDTDSGAADVVMGAKDVNVDTALPPSCGDAAACLPAVPTGWQITGLIANAATSCPTGFEPTDLISQVGAPSCTCSCTDKGTAACGDIQFSYTTDNGCAGATTVPGVASDGGCVAASAMGSNLYFKFDQPALTGVTCDGVRVGDGGVSSSPTRLCAPSCMADFCGASAMGKVKACIVHDQDTACPAGFPNRTTLATTVDPSCASCAGCTNPMGSCTGTIDFFNNTTCAPAAAYTMNLSSTCTKSPKGGDDRFGSVQVNATPPTGPFCGGSPTDPGGDAGLVGIKTVCCPP